GTGKAAIPTLAAMVQGPNFRSSRPAIQVLAKMGRSEPSAWPIVIEAFKDEPKRTFAEGELAAIGPPMLPALIKALSDPDARIRAGAAATIAQMGMLSRPAILAEMARAKPSQSYLRFKAADLAPARPALLAALKDPDAEV